MDKITFLYFIELIALFSFSIAMINNAAIKYVLSVCNALALILFSSIYLYYMKVIDVSLTYSIVDYAFIFNLTKESLALLFMSGLYLLAVLIIRPSCKNNYSLSLMFPLLSIFFLNKTGIMSIVFLEILYWLELRKQSENYNICEILSTFFIFIYCLLALSFGSQQLLLMVEVVNALFVLFLVFKCLGSPTIVKKKYFLFYYLLLFQVAYTAVPRYSLITAILPIVICLLLKKQRSSFFPIAFILVPLLLFPHVKNQFQLIVLTLPLFLILNLDLNKIFNELGILKICFSLFLIIYPGGVIFNLQNLALEELQYFSFYKMILFIILLLSILEPITQNFKGLLSININTENMKKIKINHLLLFTLLIPIYLLSNI